MELVYYASDAGTGATYSQNCGDNLGELIAVAAQFEAIHLVGDVLKQRAEECNFEKLIESNKLECRCTAGSQLCRQRHIG